MAKTKTTEFVPTISLSDIKILTLDEISEIFGDTEQYIQTELEKPNNSFNYWYPMESDFTEDAILNTIHLFTQRFLDTEIISKHVMQTEIFLNTLEKHVFAYSLIQHFNPAI